MQKIKADSSHSLSDGLLISKNVSLHISGCPQTHYIAEGDLELMIFQLLSPKLWESEVCPTVPDLFITEGGFPRPVYVG